MATKLTACLNRVNSFIAKCTDQDFLTTPFADNIRPIQLPEQELKSRGSTLNDNKGNQHRYVTLHRITSRNNPHDACGVFSSAYNQAELYKAMLKDPTLGYNLLVSDQRGHFFTVDGPAAVYYLGIWGYIAIRSCLYSSLCLEDVQAKTQPRLLEDIIKASKTTNIEVKSTEVKQTVKVESFSSTLNNFFTDLSTSRGPSIQEIDLEKNRVMGLDQLRKFVLLESKFTEFLSLSELYVLFCVVNNLTTENLSAADLKYHFCELLTAYIKYYPEAVSKKYIKFAFEFFPELFVESVGHQLAVHEMVGMQLDVLEFFLLHEMMRDSLLQYIEDPAFIDALNVKLFTSRTTIYQKIIEIIVTSSAINEDKPTSTKNTATLSPIEEKILRQIMLGNQLIVRYLDNDFKSELAKKVSQLTFCPSWLSKLLKNVDDANPFIFALLAEHPRERPEAKFITNLITKNSTEAIFSFATAKTATATLASTDAESLQNALSSFLQSDSADLNELYLQAARNGQSPELEEAFQKLTAELPSALAELLCGNNRYPIEVLGLGIVIDNLAKLDTLAKKIGKANLYNSMVDGVLASLKEDLVTHKLVFANESSLTFVIPDSHRFSEENKPVFFKRSKLLPYRQLFQLFGCETDFDQLLHEHSLNDPSAVSTNRARITAKNRGSGVLQIELLADNAISLDAKDAEELKPIGLEVVAPDLIEQSKAFAHNVAKSYDCYSTNNDFKNPHKNKGMEKLWQIFANIYAEEFFRNKMKSIPHFLSAYNPDDKDHHAAENLEAKTSIVVNKIKEIAMDKTKTSYDEPCRLTILRLKIWLRAYNLLDVILSSFGDKGVYFSKEIYFKVACYFKESLMSNPFDALVFFEELKKFCNSKFFLPKLYNAICHPLSFSKSESSYLSTSLPEVSIYSREPIKDGKKNQIIAQIDRIIKAYELLTQSDLLFAQMPSFAVDYESRQFYTNRIFDLFFLETNFFNAYMSYRDLNFFAN